VPKLRILEPISGATFSWAPGDVVEVDDATWAGMIAHDPPFGEPVEGEPGPAGESPAKRRSTRKAGV